MDRVLELLTVIFPGYNDNKFPFNALSFFPLLENAAQLSSVDLLMALSQLSGNADPSIRRAKFGEGIQKFDESVRAFINHGGDLRFRYLPDAGLSTFFGR